MDTFKSFASGGFASPAASTDFSKISWTKHPSFPGVELKDIITGKDSGGQFSFHLVRIAPYKEIGLHTHTAQLETHEVIAGRGTCLNQGAALDYFPGIISIFPAGAVHKITAGPDGCFLFAKFFPASC